MKPLVLYHDSCLDGYAAAFAAWLKLGNEAEYVPMQYGQKLVEKVDIWQREVYVLDFSFPREEMEWLFDGAKRVVWLDHHKSAFEMWCGEVYGNDNHEHWFDPHYGWNSQHHIHLNNYKSGAYLAWQWFHPGTEVPSMIQHIDDYDRWQFKLDDTKAFNKALWSYAPWSFHEWANILSDTDKPEYLRNFVREGEAILRAHDQNVTAVLKSAVMESRVEISDNDDCDYAYGLAANCPPHLTSDVGHELANQSGTFGLCWTLGKEGLIAKCSLRSNGGYDVSAIAKCFGGGGHRNAAGFEVDIQTLLGWLKCDPA